MKSLALLALTLFAASIPSLALASDEIQEICGVYTAHTDAAGGALEDSCSFHNRIVAYSLKPAAGIKPFSFKEGKSYCAKGIVSPGEFPENWLEKNLEYRSAKRVADLPVNCQPETEDKFRECSAQTLGDACTIEYTDGSRRTGKCMLIDDEPSCELPAR
jgi:hypothetical protein